VGFASSTIIAERIKDLLQKEGLSDEVRILQCTLNEIPGHLDSADCIVTSSKTYGTYPIPVLNGVAFLSGIGVEDLEKKIIEILRA
jgi:Phosphotransferase system, galactitol-specific IIB component